VDHGLVQAAAPNTGGSRVRRQSSSARTAASMTEQLPFMAQSMKV